MVQEEKHGLTEAEEPPLVLREKLDLEREILAPLSERAGFAWIMRFGGTFHELVDGSPDVRRLLRHPELLSTLRRELPKLAPADVLRCFLPELIEPARVVRRLLRRHS